MAIPPTKHINVPLDIVTNTTLPVAQNDNIDDEINLPDTLQQCSIFKRRGTGTVYVTGGFREVF